jgi:hypothetical protein
MSVRVEAEINETKRGRSTGEKMEMAMHGEARKRDESPFATQKNMSSRKEERLAGLSH